MPSKIVERQYTMDDIVEAVEEGRMVEAFVAGTAVCDQAGLSYTGET